MSSSEAQEDSKLAKKHPSDATLFASSLVEQVNSEDIASMVFIQRDMLSRFEKTNEMLINFNILSTGRYDATVKDFQKYTQLLYDMKKDLDGVFKRIRVLKQRLEKNYPEAFAACSSIYNIVSDEDDESDDESLSTVQSSLVSEEPKQHREVATSPTHPAMTSTRTQESSTEVQCTRDPPNVTVTKPQSPTSKTQS